MPVKTEEQRLFGAACVYVTLERSGLTPQSNELYLATLAELGVEPGAVEAFLSEKRRRVEDALDHHGAQGK